MKTATFKIAAIENNKIFVDYVDMCWIFTFDLTGGMLDGFELAHHLTDEGEALAEWAISATVGDSEAFPIIEE